jgi:3-deoxy-manno-octulosonate cytidylyltransferase (CMP-KDO synthetase)
MTTRSPFGVIVPARYASTRLPGKPLRDICGKPMIVHVLERALQSGASWVVVATDDERIQTTVEAAGGEAMLTAPHHASGTDRLAEVAARRNLPGDAIVVNVQGDEPLIDPRLVARTAEALALRNDAGIATVATPVAEARDVFDPNLVKVVIDRSNLALYFSRAPIPWVRGTFESEPAAGPRLMTGPFLRHVGLYAYRVRTLRQLAEQAPVDLERLESLEQLRALWLGIGIHVTVVDEPPGHGVDTEADLARVIAILARSAGDRDGYGG